MSFLLAAPNIVFTVALGLLGLMLLLEFAGSGFSDLLESMFPDVDGGIPDSDVPDGGDISMPSQFLSWLRAGRVPMLMVFAVFLGIYGAGGLFLQHVATTLFGQPVPMLLASIVMLPLSLPFVRMGSSLLGRFMPRDETAALSQDDLIGRIAIIVTGHARKGFPAQAKLRDEFRTTHYVMIEPDADGIELRQGDEVALMSRRGAVYVAKAVAPRALTHEA